ncbi:hypothetical protein I3843_15G103000 [Carya illinoinensis]|nr:hypothetical protein I3843_15G103000 [Carya illinoinensis]
MQEHMHTCRKCNHAADQTHMDSTLQQTAKHSDHMHTCRKCKLQQRPLTHADQNVDQQHTNAENMLLEGKLFLLLHMEGQTLHAGTNHMEAGQQEITWDHAWTESSSRSF